MGLIQVPIGSEIDELAGISKDHNDIKSIVYAVRGSRRYTIQTGSKTCGYYVLIENMSLMAADYKPT